jgi:hypothetical protein
MWRRSRGLPSPLRPEPALLAKDLIFRPFGLYYFPLEPGRTRMPTPKKPRASCLNCGAPAKLPGAKYCSNRCQADYQYQRYVQAWKTGTESGLKADESVSDHIRRYLLHKYGERCSACGWTKRHSKTGQVPLSIHHIDGNWRNNTEDNLALLCPNCHALTDNYMNLNKGSGRRYRRKYEPRQDER